MVLGSQLLPHGQRPIGKVARGAADPDGGAVPQEAAHFPEDHGDSVSGKHNLTGGVKIVHRLDQPNATDLKQIVHNPTALAASGETLYDGEHQPQIAENHILPRLPPRRRIQRLVIHAEKQRLLLLLGENLQPRRIDAAYDNLTAVHGSYSPFFSVKGV